MKNKKILTLAVAAGFFANVAAASTPSELLNYYCAKPDVDKSVTVQVGEAIRIIPKAGGMNLMASKVESDPQLVEILSNLFEVDPSCAEFLLVNGGESLSNGDRLLARVYFNFDSSQLTPQSIEVLNRIASIGRQTKHVFELEGHTDAVGESQYNFALGLKRSEQVKAYLEQRGVDRDQLNALSFGEKQPLNDNASAQQREQNRRVDIK